MDDFILTVSAEAPQYNFKQELLDNLLNDAIEQVADLAEAKQIKLRDESECTNVFVRTNTRLFVRALVNLLFNAVKFSPSGSSITIQIRCDNLEGESAQALIQLCNPVEPHNQSLDLTPSMPGFGLGLDFVDTVIRKHQGTIERYIPPSGIATVTITLPCTLD
jgi:signal transduction histidine kinase